jgi:hypothetical protein
MKMFEKIKSIPLCPFLLVISTAGIVGIVLVGIGKCSLAVHGILLLGMAFVMTLLFV